MGYNHNMDFIDEKGIVHKGFNVKQALKFGWKPVGQDADKVEIKEEVAVKAEEE